MGRLAERVALITGAAGGIGAATARRLAEDGARVALADLNADTVRTVAVRNTASVATLTTFSVVKVWTTAPVNVLVLQNAETSSTASEPRYATTSQANGGTSNLRATSNQLQEEIRRTQILHDVNNEQLKLLTAAREDANRLLAFSLFGEVYLSENTGDSWHKIPREFGEIRAAAWLPN